jgi:hypothetical protein
MAQISRQVGTTSQVTLLQIYDGSSTTGAGLTGLAFNTASLTCYYKRSNGTASVAVTLANITTLGTFVSGGFKEVDATNQPGLYEFHPPNAALASGADSVAFTLKGATNMAPCTLLIELTATSNQDATAGGISRLDGTITSRMATYTQPTGFLAATFPTGTIANTTNITAGTITTTTNLTNLPAITSNWLTAAGIAAGALSGKGDWNVGKTGYSLTATTGLGNQTANITGNLSGSVGSVTGAVGSITGVTFPTNFSALAITAGGIAKADLDTIKTQAVTCAGGVTIPTGTLASTTNIAIVNSVNGLMNSTIASAVWDEILAGHTTGGSAGKIVYDNLNATVTSRMATYTQPTGFLAATFPATVASTTNITAATGVTLTATTGLGNQTANITGNLSGSVGSVTGAVGSVTGAVGSVTGLTNATIADAVWDEARSGHTTAGTFGLYLDAQVSTAGGGSLTEAGIADAVWDEILSGHATVGSTGAALSAAGGSGDPWSTALPGAYGAGTAGYIVGTQMGAPVAATGTVKASPTPTTTTFTLETVAGSRFASRKTLVIDSLAGEAVRVTSITLNGSDWDVVLTTALSAAPAAGDKATILGFPATAASDDTPGTTTILSRVGGNVALAGVAPSWLVSEATIAGAVWDELLFGHFVDGSAGLALATASSGGVDPNILAAAVWDFLQSSLGAGSTMGQLVASYGNYKDPWVATGVTLLSPSPTVNGFTLDTGTLDGSIDLPATCAVNLPAYRGQHFRLASYNSGTGAVVLADPLPTSPPTDASFSVEFATGLKLASDGLDSIVIEAGINARQAISLIAAAEAGRVSGNATNSPVFKGANTNTTRITATTTADGDRTAITLSPPA